MSGQTDVKRRRSVLGAGALLGTYLLPTRAIAATAARSRTPAQSRGPFYPSALPSEHDNDLVQVAGRSAALGQPAQLSGQVLDVGGRQLSGVLVEIWQCDANGRYHHPADAGPGPLDPGFQGYGQYTTAADGAYRFRTIRPVPYPGRTPHIHFRLSRAGVERLVTQLYVAGEPGNTADALFNAQTSSLRNRLTAAFTQRAGSRELEARFDIVLA